MFHVFQHTKPLHNSAVLVSTDDYNQQREKMSDLKGKLDLHYKGNMWKGATEVLSKSKMKL